MKKSLFSTLVFFTLCAPALAAGAPHWNVALSQSSFSFRGKQMGAEFHGTFGKLTPDINFDPAHPDIGDVKVDFDVATFGSGDKDRDKTAMTKDWFDFDHFPAARFEAHAFKKTGPNAYEAEGTLTIKGVTVPQKFPFTLDITPDGDMTRAHMKASAIVDRSKFGLGVGQWADTSVIANEVTVDMDLIAFKQK